VTGALISLPNTNSGKRAFAIAVALYCFGDSVAGISMAWAVVVFVVEMDEARMCIIMMGVCAEE
jgi:hypothetical protein